MAFQLISAILYSPSKIRGGKGALTFARAYILPYTFFIPHFLHSLHQNLGVGSVGSVTCFSYRPITRACAREKNSCVFTLNDVILVLSGGHFTNFNTSDFQNLQMDFQNQKICFKIS